MKIAVVTCYSQNGYIRARTLRAAFTACPGVETRIIRNRHKGVLRYPEVMLRVFKARLFDKPDAYVITFRGYEMLLLMKLTLVRKPIIFDELVNFTEWMVEHGRLAEGSVPYRLFRRWNAWMVRRSRFILADTGAHATHSAILNKLSIERYRTIPVGSDENVFRPMANAKSDRKDFTVAYYGSMLALHGLPYILEAARQLKDRREIRFRIIGGKRKVAELCGQAAQDGANVTHEDWVPFSELPNVIKTAGLTLGGPFGNTQQSQFVITGKTFQPLSAGRPVLVGKNQVHEGFADKQNCLMVPQADPKAIAGAITWAYENPEKLEGIGKAGYDLYERQFSQKVINKRVEEIVRAL